MRLVLRLVLRHCVQSVLRLEVRSMWPAAAGGAAGAVGPMLVFVAACGCCYGWRWGRMGSESMTRVVGGASCERALGYHHGHVPGSHSPPTMTSVLGLPL